MSPTNLFNISIIVLSEPFSTNMVLNFEMMSMDTTGFLGLFAIIGGLVFYFTSGAFSIVSASLGITFQISGIVLIYIGIALVMWSVLSSLNIFLERFVRRS